MKQFSRMTALLLTLALVLSACAGGGKAPAPSTAPPASSGETAPAPAPDTAAFAGQTITALFMSGSYADMAREVVVPKFEAATGAKVEIVDFPYASLHEKMLLDLTSNTASYDLVDITCQWDGEMAPFLEPLDPYIARDGFDIDDFDSNILDNSGRWQGTIYGIPHVNTPYTLAYRTDLVEKPPETLDEYIALAEKYHDPSKGMYGVAPAMAKNQYGSIFFGRLWSLGGEWADENWNATMNTPEVRRALEVTMRLKELSDPACLSWGLPESAAAFANGNAVFLEGWPTLNFLGIADDPQQCKIVGKWALCPFPAEKTGLTALSSWDIAINKNSEKKDLAWEFIKTLVELENQNTGFQEYNILPTRISFWEQEEIKQSPLFPLKDALSNALIWWRIPASEEAKTEISNGFGAYLAGEKNIEEAMDYMQNCVEIALMNNPPPEGLLNVTAQTVQARIK